MQKVLLSLVVSILIRACAMAQNADLIAADNASAEAYVDGWQAGDNGGFGFEPWEFHHFFDAEFSPYSDATFVAENAFVDIPTNGPAFGHTTGNRASWGYTSWSLRPFSSPLEVGQTFSIDLDNPVLAPLSKNDPAGVFIRLRDTDNEPQMTLLAQSDLNNANWTLFDTSQKGFDTNLSSNTTASGGFNFRLTMLEHGAYDLTLTPLGGGPPAVFRREFPNPEHPIGDVAVVIYDNGSSADGSKEFYANNLGITDASTSEFIWDGSGDGTWSELRWSVPDRIPSGSDTVMIIHDRVTVHTQQFAAATKVETGELRIDGQLDSPISVSSNGAISGDGAVFGDVALDGQFVVRGLAALDIVGELRLMDAKLVIDGQHSLVAGANTGLFDLVQADSVQGEFQVVENDYIGGGVFVDLIEHTSEAVQVDLYTAWPGDANRDGNVDISDFNIWNDHRGMTAASWLIGDFNDDSIVDSLDFEIWNANKFSSATALTSVPEPEFEFTRLVTMLIVALRRRMIV